jgi:hypothetical protein
MTFVSQLNKEVSIAGAYLFCVYKTYHSAYEGRLKPTGFDEYVLKTLESMLESVAKYNSDLVRYLSDFIAVSGTKEGADLSPFCIAATVVKDFHDSTSSSLLWQRECAKLRREAGLIY